MTKGVGILALVSLGIAVAISSVLVYSIILEEQLQKENGKVPHANNTNSHMMQHVFGSHLDRSSIDLIIILVLLVTIMSVVFSILLLVGIKKNMPCLVLSYLGFGVFLFLFLMVAAVLQFLQSWWYMAVITTLVALSLLVRLPSVYFVYEEMRENEPRLITEVETADTMENLYF